MHHPSVNGRTANFALQSFIAGLTGNEIGNPWQHGRKITRNECRPENAISHRVCTERVCNCGKRSVP
jgi:hypothetical protein